MQPCNGPYIGSRNNYNCKEIAKCKYCGTGVLVMKHLNLQTSRWEYYGEPICDECRYLIYVDQNRRKR